MIKPVKLVKELWTFIILMKGFKLVKCACQIKEPVITNININEMRFKEKDMKKMRNIEK